jgi:hypothetical protein
MSGSSRSVCRRVHEQDHRPGIEDRVTLQLLIRLCAAIDVTQVATPRNITRVQLTRQVHSKPQDFSMRVPG